jgi:hypothetical protein
MTEQNDKRSFILGLDGLSPEERRMRQDELIEIGVTESTLVLMSQLPAAVQDAVRTQVRIDHSIQSARASEVEA